MTSQRFLNDKVNLRDFLRSLLEACKAPIVALLFISFSVIGPVAKLAKALKQNLQYMELLKKHEMISYFGGIKGEGEYYDAAPLSFLMILCGIVVAFSLLSFAFKKNSVNVYFSAGITRTRLFLNRIAAGAIELFAVALIPYLIVFLMNVGMFGFHSHQFKLFAYYTVLMFIRGMSGFAIGALAAAVSGSMIEALFTSGSVSIIALLALALLGGIKSSFLPGYVGDDALEKALILSPWTGLLGNSEADQLITGKKVPKELLLTWKGDFYPIVFWAIAAVIIFAVGLVLFKKRKNENTASFGKFSIASALNGTTVLLVSLVALTAVFNSLYRENKIKSVALCVILITLISFIIFFVAELIIRRNFKAVLRMLPVYGGIALVMFAALLVIGTGYFGTYNKLPEVKDIEYISMSYDDPLTTFTYVANVYSPEDYDKENDYNCKSSNPEDIKMCIEQFDKVKTEKREGRNFIDRISFVIKTKDGKFITRYFNVYSEETCNNYNKAVFDSNYFHSIIKYRLNSESSNGNYTDRTENMVMYGTEYGDKYIENSVSFDYYNGDLLANAEVSGYETEVFSSSFEMTEELKAAIYEDLCNITYDEYYGNKGKPQGAIVESSYTAMNEAQQYRAEDGWFDFYTNYGDSDAEKVSKRIAVAYRTILVYPQMAKTAELLNETEQMPQTAQVKAVICPDKKLTLTDAFNNVSGGSVYSYGGTIDSTVFVSYLQSSRAIDFFMSGDEVSKIFGGKMTGTYLDFIELIYGANGVNVTRIDDKAKAQKISDEAYSVYNMHNDNGRCVFVIYDDGSVIAKYLPEKAMSVLN